MSAPHDFFDFTVTQLDQNIRHGCGFHAVGSHDGGCLLLVRESAQNFQDDVPSGGVQISSGLIRQQDAGGVDQCPGDGGALHLATGELMGKTITKPVHFYPAQTFFRRCSNVSLTREQQRQLNIFKNGKGLQQLEGLENKSDFFSAQLSEASIIQVHGASKIEKSRFSAAASADQRDELAALNVQRDAIQRVDVFTVIRIVFGNILQGKYGHE